MSKRDIAIELHKPARKNYTRRRVNVYGKNDLWQADLVEMIPYLKKKKGIQVYFVHHRLFYKICLGITIKIKNGKGSCKCIIKNTTQSYAKAITDR